MLARLVTVLLLAIACATHAQAQSSPPILTITTHSTGSMIASDVARSELGLPDGRFDYELVYTADFAPARMEFNGPLSFFAPGTGTVTLTVGGTSHTFHDFNDSLYTAAQFASNVPFGGQTDYFQHNATIGSYYGVGLSGYQRVEWPAGQFPGTQAFTEQSWVFDGPAVGEVYFNLVIGGERVGHFAGTAEHFEMSISAVPEPTRLALLLAGLAAAGLLHRTHGSAGPKRRPGYCLRDARA